MKDDIKVLIDRVDDLYRQVEENVNMSINLEKRITETENKLYELGREYHESKY